MTLGIIIAIALLVLYFIGKNKQKNQTLNIPSIVHNQKESVFHSKISSLNFPDRIDAIDWHRKKIQEGLKTGDIALANLSYAKLYESLRQQNVNENGSYDDVLVIIQQEYKDFRTHFNVEYPEQFLPPEERKNNKDRQYEKLKDAAVYLETGNYHMLPKQILKYVDIVKPISEWYEIGIKPQREGERRWKAIKRNDRYFGFYDADLNKTHNKISFETGKRITKKPYFIKALHEQGIPLTDFVIYGEDIECFVRAVDYFEEQKYDQAQKEIDKALAIKKYEDYGELKIDIEIKLNNEHVVDREFKKYSFDIDSAIHTGKMNDWLRVLINNHKYEKVMVFIEKANNILDNLSTGAIQSKIYGKQSSDYYQSKKEQFNKNLIYLFDSKNLAVSKSDNAIKLLELFLNLYNKEDFKPIEKIADQFYSWGLTDRAVFLYHDCLKMIESEDKPRVRLRLEKKISQIS